MLGSRNSASKELVDVLSLDEAKAVLASFGDKWLWCRGPNTWIHTHIFLSFDALEHALVATIARGQESTDLLLGHIASCNRLVEIADLGLGRRYPIRQLPIRCPLFFVGADKPAKARFFLFEYEQRKGRSNLYSRE